ncbi:MAG: hypothetical protein KO318_10725 [Methanobacterium sp.]|nr:hypothetical protein [Methanobacterium sp.]
MYTATPIQSINLLYTPSNLNQPNTQINQPKPTQHADQQFKLLLRVHPF